jgi:small-conductance mechanosensitive channel
LELYRLKGLYDHDVTESSFEPRLLISEIAGASMTLSLRIWIREINKKDEIVSDYLESLWKRLPDEHIALD